MVKLAMREQAKELMTYKGKVEGNGVLVKASQGLSTTATESGKGE
jgi:hypothetical protein